jgi:DNA-binding MarR family transcriptional regulator
MPVQPHSHDLEHLPFDSAEQRVFLNLWRTYDCLKALEEEVFSDFELSAQQYNALRLLRAAAPELLQTSTLGKRLISRSPDMTRLLDRLERRGLVSRVRSLENRRVVNIGITGKGVQLLEGIADRMHDLHARQLGHLKPAEQRQLVDLLKKARAPHDDQSCNWMEDGRS